MDQVIRFFHQAIILWSGPEGIYTGLLVIYILTERFCTFSSKHIMDIGVIIVWFA